MSKNTYFFDHDYNARNDERILQLRAEHGAEAYGVYWMLLESMAEASNGEINRGAIGGLSLGYGVPKERLSAIIDYCLAIGLFNKSQGEAIFSERMMSHRARIESMREGGRRGAMKRWSTSQKNSPPNTKERKGNERKEDNTIISGEQSSPTPNQIAKEFFNNETKQKEYVARLAENMGESFAKEEVKKFLYYWTEPTRRGDKVRWETEKCFEVNRRLTTWMNKAISNPYRK